MLSRDHNRGSSGHSRWKTLLNEFVPWNPGQSLVRSSKHLHPGMIFQNLHLDEKKLLLTLEESTELLLILAAIVNEVIAERRGENTSCHTFMFSKLSTPSMRHRSIIRLRNGLVEIFTKTNSKLSLEFSERANSLKNSSKKKLSFPIYLLQLPNESKAWKFLLFNRITLVRNFS